MNILRTIFKGLAVVVAFVAVGCATPSTTEYSELEAQSLRAWMDKNYNGWESDPDWMRTDEGVYIHWMKRSDLPAPADTIIKEGNWVRIDYTGKTLDGDIFYTRNAGVAKIQGTYSRRTHYVDDFVYLYSENASLPKGTFQALTNMKVGDMTRVVMPSNMYRGSNGYNDTNVGYNGQWGISGDVPVILDSLTIAEVSEDPITLENKQVNKFAADRWRLTEADTVSKGLYVQLMTPFPVKRDSVVSSTKTDSVLTCYYKGYFLDGFVFDSNIDSVQMRAWGEIVNKGPMEWDMKKTSMIEGFKEACIRACYGDHLRVVFTSAYGYGISGSAARAVTQSSSSSDSSDDMMAYYNYLNYYSYMNSMYGGGYGYGGYGSYYNNYYNSYYNPYYYNYYNNLNSSSSDSSSTEDEEEEVKVSISTEILPFTPLVFEIWVCADDGSAKTPENNTL
ncbi:MAG: FKBP-type peptidyl-prolyl cis-trans isomerase [Tidjanibacter sp.]|nr:FKBP-type peptidyl-prolyl cis-trans isomerase [Tidjanibacter sp.]